MSHIYVKLVEILDLPHLICCPVDNMFGDNDSNNTMHLLREKYNSFAPLAALKSHLCIVPASRSPKPPPLPPTPAAPSPESPPHNSLAFFFSSPRCTESTACPTTTTTSDVAVDTSSEITTKDLKEKKEVVKETENGRDTPANGSAPNEENGEQEADNEVDDEEGGEEEEEEEGDGEEEDGDEDEEADVATGKRAAEDDEDEDVDTKKQKTDEND
ncbi:prothymosin alpha-like [Perognathus longimembris pacificus]|uniref:prothymosin alpha-like n=1 Tax=Perognathus longimembris pacificus TaxID=214514 RepID=UPI0020190FF2|nr:prothymosin alpha-like [Perognathus longimembris pacificus]